MRATSRRTEPLLADDGVAGFAGLALSGLVDGLDPERVLLLLHQALQLMLRLGNVLRDADPVLAARLLELDDVAFDLGAAVVLRPRPGQQGRRLADVPDDGFTRSPGRV